MANPGSLDSLASSAPAPLELAKLKEELGNLRQTFEACLNTAHAGLVLCNASGHVVVANGNAQTLLGSATPAVGTERDAFLDGVARRFADPEAYRQRISELLGRSSPASTIPTGLRQIARSSLSLRGADERTVCVGMDEVVTSDGQLVGSVWSFQDTTNLKRDEELLHTVGDSSPSALIVSRRSDGLILYANQVASEMFRATAEPLVGRHGSAEYYAIPEDRDRVLAKLNEQRRVLNQEIELKRLDGSTFWALLSLAQLELDGELAIVATMTDISERRQQEDALRLSEERFRMLVENANEITFLLAPDFRIPYISPNVTRFLGYSVEEATNANWLDVVHPEDQERARIYVTDVLRNGGSAARLGCRLRASSGEWRHFRLSGGRVQWDASGERHFIGTGHDVTDQEAARAELANTQLMLQRTEKMASLGRLAAGIAHEINTPIAAMMSAHDSLLRAVNKLKTILEHAETPELKQSPQLQHMLRVIDDSNEVINMGGQRVAEIVKRLRTFARLDTSELQRTNIEAGIDETLRLLQHQLKHRIQVEKDFKLQRPLCCFPGRLNQVFLNLLVNAAQSISGKGTVTIRTYASDGVAHVAVSDTGAGIRPEHVAKLFDPGFTTKDVDAGTGLGLAICNQIVQEHHGKISVTSEGSGGSTFEVTLPLNLDELLQKPEPAS